MLFLFWLYHVFFPLDFFAFEAMEVVEYSTLYILKKSRIFCIAMAWNSIDFDKREKFSSFQSQLIRIMSRKDIRLFARKNILPFPF